MKPFTALEAKQLGCIRQNKSLFALVSFVLPAGEALLIEGPNGAGKSSLLRLIAGIATPAEGYIYWNGNRIQKSFFEYTEQLHYLSHSNGIRPGLTIAENLKLAGELSQHSITDIDEVLSILNLTEHKNIQAQFLSAGQKRRVGLARLFLIPRKLWILDEPLTSLDIATQKTLLAKIESHLENGGSCVMTSHQPVELNDAPIQRLALQPC